MKFKALKNLTVKDNKDMVTLKEGEVIELSDSFISNPNLELVVENKVKKQAVKKTVVKKKATVKSSVKNFFKKK